MKKQHECKNSINAKKQHIKMQKVALHKYTLPKITILYRKWNDLLLSIYFKVHMTQIKKVYSYDRVIVWHQSSFGVGRQVSNIMVVDISWRRSSYGV